MGGKARLEFLRGWIGIAIVNARERPAVALSFAVGAAAVLPAAVAAFSIAFFVFVVCFAALSLPIGATTAVWWGRHAGLRQAQERRARGRGYPGGYPGGTRGGAPARRRRFVRTGGCHPGDAPAARPLLDHDDHDERGGPVHHAHVPPVYPTASRKTRRTTPTACLTHRGLDLRELSPGFLPNLASLSRVRVLDLGGNELGELPGLERLAGTLEHLRLSRNWFARVPPEVKHLKMLKELDMSRNFVRFTDEALPMNALGDLERLRVVDFRYNRKLFKQTHVDALRSRDTAG